MLKKIAVLLNNSIYNDSRVIKIIDTLSGICQIDLFYINGDIEKDKKLFNSNVQLYPTKHESPFFSKIIRHSFFCYEFNFMIKLVLNKKIKYDYVWANDLPTLYPSHIIAKKLKAKLVYDSHEIYTETINQFFPRYSQGIKKSLIQIMIFFMRQHGKRIEKKIIPRVQTFITVNESILKYFKSKCYIPNGIVLMNLPLSANIHTSTEKFDYRKQFGWKEKDTILLYQGNLNEGRGLRLLIDVLKIMGDEIKLVIIGEGPLKDHLVNQVSLAGLQEKIKFFDLISLKELPRFTKGADIGINLLEDFNLSKKLASPNKLFEYIHSGLPVLCSNTIENKRVIDQFEVGVLVNNNVRVISEKLIFLTQMNNTQKDKFKIEILKAQNFFCWENQIETIKSIVK